ncbi:MAG: TIGR00730 family Rossman fold protein [Myxococcales bacterium]|nr:TIGR00730 family Rossman fold protein [Myxococcales bacterium]
MSATITPRKPFRRVAVYCGSSNKVDPVYLETARAVGEELARRGVTIVYGGGRAGLMGQVADGALSQGGEVVGVITEKLMGLEVGHMGLTELFVTPSMASRKAMMAQLADAFIALPGGWGTIEELFEVATLSQLNHHLKPVGILNVNQYYNALIAFLMHAEQEGFVRPSHAGMIKVARELPALLSLLEAAEIPRFGSWAP